MRALSIRKGVVEQQTRSPSVRGPSRTLGASEGDVDHGAFPLATFCAVLSKLLFSLEQQHIFRERDNRVLRLHQTIALTLSIFRVIGSNDGTLTWSTRTEVRDGPVWCGRS